MQTLWQDLRYTLRQLRNAPVFALTAILTLALGLGATTAMLAIVDSVLIHAVALPHAERIVNLGRAVKGQQEDYLQYKDFEALEARTKGLAAIAAYQSLPAPVVVPAGPRVLLVYNVSPRFFAVSGAPAQRGRLLGPDDKNAPVAVISNAFWREMLNGDPHVIGSSIKVASTLVHIVGVLPSNFSFPQSMEGPAVYVPLIVNAKGENEHGFTAVPVVARLKPGVTAKAASAEAQAVYAHLPPVGGDDRGQLLLRSYRDTMTSHEQPALIALLGACAVLLLIACANAANLQIARATTRTGEMSVRAALGASRRRLLQQIATESLTVSLLGAALGLMPAVAALHWIRTAYQHQFARFDEISLHPAMFIGCSLLAVAAGLLAALAPASNVLRNSGGLPSSQAMRVTKRSHLSGSLVAFEVALTLVLLITAGLFIRTFRSLEQAPLGFNPNHVTGITLMPVNPQESGPALKQTYDRLLDRLGTLPGVEAVGTQTTIPFSAFNLSLSSSFRVIGLPEHKEEHLDLSLINAGYSRALGVALHEGRNLSPNDSFGTQPVGLVNDAFVRRFLHGQRVSGHVVEFTSDTKDGTDDRFLKQPVTIVGVLADEVSGDLGNKVDPTLFLSYRQFPPDSKFAKLLFGIAPQFAVRSSLPPTTLEHELRAALKDTAPNMAEMQIYSLQTSIAASLTTSRLALRLASGFGLLALALAAIGIYGVLAYSVAQRTREIGIRMALGSTRQGAMTLVLRQAGVMVAAGLAVGLLGVWPAGRAVKAFLFGVTPFDPLTLFAAAAVLLLVCACAAAIPAYRATQVDPMEALRSE